jgi:ADP-ribosyl-[dinitrogen reductase] hydrolase
VARHNAIEVSSVHWPGDTSMALCLATSLVERRGFDAADQMRRYRAWLEDGYLSSTGRCFDIGATTADALERFRASGDPWSGSADPRTAGNGSLMRLAPVALFFHPDREQVLHYAAESSRTTHAAPQCLAACRLMAELLHRALNGVDKQQLLFGDVAGLEAAVAGTASAGPAGAGPTGAHDEPLLSIARGEYRDKREPDIRSDGYVVHTLEAALWCFYRTDSFEAAILAAANLGHDADTTAAVCGQVAGAFYGEPGIPRRWLLRLAMREEIEALADRLAPSR